MTEDDGKITPAFHDHLDLRKHGAGRWIMLHEFRFDSAVIGARLIVPEGFITDLASVPRFPPFAFAIAGESAEAAAVLHDFAYRIRTEPRWKCDALFYEAMATDGSAFNIPAEPAWRRGPMWLAVRLGGWFAWATE